MLSEREEVWLWDIWLEPVEEDDNPRGPKVTGKHVFFLKDNGNIVNRMWVFEIIYPR